MGWGSLGGRIQRLVGSTGLEQAAAGATGERRGSAECVSRMGTLTYFGWADCVDDWRCCDAQLPCHAGWVDTGGLGTARSGHSLPDPDSSHPGEVVCNSANFHVD